MNATNNLQKNPREIIKTIANNHSVISTIKDLPRPLRTRQFIYENAWVKQPDGSYVLASRPPATDEFEDNRLIDIGKNKQRRMVRGESRGFVVIRNLDEQKSKLTWILQVDVKGNISSPIMNKSIARSLRPVFQVREKFTRNDEVDKMERQTLMDIMRSSYQEEVYDVDETTLIDSIRSRMAAVPNDAFRPLDSPDFRTKMSIAHIEGENAGYAKCEVVIDASLEEVAAYNFIYMSRKRVKLNDRKDVLHRVAKDINNYTLDYITVRDLGFGRATS